MGQSVTASSDSIEEIAKKNLEIIILAILKERPMCGYDLIKEIYENYNILMSQGLVYPLLYSLKDGGILQVGYLKGNTRTKIYSPTEKGRIIIENKLDEFVRASEYLIQSIRGK